MRTVKDEVGRHQARWERDKEIKGLSSRMYSQGQQKYPVVHKSTGIFSVNIYCENHQSNSMIPLWNSCSPISTKLRKMCFFFHTSHLYFLNILPPAAHLILLLWIINSRCLPTDFLWDLEIIYQFTSSFIALCFWNNSIPPAVENTFHLKKKWHVSMWGFLRCQAG